MMEDAKEKEKKSVKQIYISILALTLMNVTIIAGSVMMFNKLSMACLL